jgi:hypothetical protein
MNGTWASGMSRNGTLTGAFSLLFLGWLMLPRAISGDYAWFGTNWWVWVVFGIAMGVLSGLDKVLFWGTNTNASLGNFFQKSRLGHRTFKASRSRPGWFTHLWTVLGVGVAGLLIWAIQRGVAPEFFEDKGMEQLWPLVLLYLGLGQVIGFGIDLLRRLTGSVL